MFAALAPATAHSAVNCSFNAAWGTNEDALRQQVVTLTNQHRASIGLGPLAYSPTLTASALWKSGHMAGHDYFDHDDQAFAPLSQPRSFFQRVPDCDYPFGGFGENIAYGYASAQSVMNGWLTSPGHRANIERASYNAIGVGVVRDSGGRLWWTQNFGSGIDGAGSPPPGSPPPTGDPAGAAQPRPQPSGGPAENNVVTSSKLAVSGFQVRAAKIRAGKRFRARMVARRAPGAPVRRQMAVRCPAVVTGDRTVKVVRTKLRSLGSGRIRATCVWRVPKKSVGTKLAAQVVVVARGDSARIAFAGRVRRA